MLNVVVVLCSRSTVFPFLPPQAPGEIRTHDPLLTRQPLWPTELREALGSFSDMPRSASILFG